jgi:hypothetical protein
MMVLREEEGIKMSTTALVREQFSLYISGKFVPGSSGKTFSTSSPYAGQESAEVAEGTVADVDSAVASARAALAGPWGQMTGFGRSALLWPGLFLRPLTSASHSYS